MASFKTTEAAERYAHEIWELYMKYYRDPDNPEEYFGLDDEGKKLRRLDIEEENKYLMKKVEAFVHESRSGVPLKVLVYRNGRYRYSLIETVKARVRYYFNKYCRKRWDKVDF
jgi:hypothetical protein